LQVELSQVQRLIVVTGHAAEAASDAVMHVSPQGTQSLSCVQATLPGSVLEHAARKRSSSRMLSSFMFVMMLNDYIKMADFYWFATRDLGINWILCTEYPAFESCRCIEVLADLWRLSGQIRSVRHVTHIYRMRGQIMQRMQLYNYRTVSFNNSSAVLDSIVISFISDLQCLVNSNFEYEQLEHSVKQRLSLQIRSFNAYSFIEDILHSSKSLIVPELIPSIVDYWFWRLLQVVCNEECARFRQLISAILDLDGARSPMEFKIVLAVTRDRGK
jgi:hypothetical protein